MKTSWKNARAVALGASLTLLPAILLAAEHGEGAEAGNPWVSLLWKFLNFGILAGGLFYFLRKPISQGLVDRHEGVRRALAEAKQAKEAAEAKYRDYRERVARIDDEVRAIQDEFRAEGERQREKLLRDAEAAADAARRQAETAGANEVKRVRDELRAEMAEMAVRLAEEMVTSAYSAQDQKKAVQETIEKIERVH